MEVVHCKDNGKDRIVVQGDNNSQMEMAFCGGDFAFIMYNYYEDNRFVIDYQNELYPYFEKLFEGVSVYDRPNNRMLTGKRFVWISEDYGEYEKANRLTITEEPGQFTLQFYNNPEREFAVADMCAINICQSGSRNQEIACLFALLFNELVRSETITKVKKSGSN